MVCALQSAKKGEWAGWENGEAEEQKPKHSEDDWGKW